MTPERWQHIKGLFESALERAPDERSAFLDQACAGDLGLRREVESLIASHEQTGSFIDSPAYELGAALLTEDQVETLVGQRIAHYEILALLGSGGMGEVYLAQDTRLGREIALKLLPAGFTKDGNRLRRFEQEARVASALNHPNICMIHEVGETEDDRHYIAMEYVDGVTLRQHITETRMQIGEALDVAMHCTTHGRRLSDLKRLIRKNYPPAKSIIGSISLNNRDFISQVKSFHQECEIQTRWPTTDDVNFQIADSHTAFTFRPLALDHDYRRSKHDGMLLAACLDATMPT